MVKTQKGFTLIELMIVIAIIGILAAVAVPQYGQYTKRAKFAEVITATAAVKTAVSLCYQTTNNIGSCDGGAEGIPDDLTVDATRKVVAGVVTADGIITSTGGTELDARTYILEPVDANGAVLANGAAMVWQLDEDSTCLDDNLCK